MEQVRVHGATLVKPALGHRVFPVVADALILGIARTSAPALVFLKLELAIVIHINDIAVFVHVRFPESRPQIGIAELLMPENALPERPFQFVTALVQCIVIIAIRNLRPSHPRQHAQQKHNQFFHSLCILDFQFHFSSGFIDRGFSRFFCNFFLFEPIG